MTDGKRTRNVKSESMWVRTRLSVLRGRLLKRKAWNRLSTHIDPSCRAPLVERTPPALGHSDSSNMPLRAINSHLRPEALHKLIATFTLAGFFLSKLKTIL